VRRADGPSAIWSPLRRTTCGFSRGCSQHPTHQRRVSPDAQVANAVTPHRQHPIGAWLAPADNITGGPSTRSSHQRSRTTPPSAQAADAGQGIRSRCSWSFSHAEPTRSSASMRRSDQPCPTRRTPAGSPPHRRTPRLARRACRLAAQQAVCRWIARRDRTLARRRGSPCWSVPLRHVWAAVTWRGGGARPAWSSRRRTTVMVVVPSSLARCAGLARCRQRGRRWPPRSVYPCARAWRWRRRCWGSRTAKPPLRVSVQGVCAGGGYMRLECRGIRLWVNPLTSTNTHRGIGRC
jgi:hypothetical protein